MAHPDKTWRVIIVDDSRTMQVMLENAFSARSDFNVIGVANDAAAGIEMIRRLRPDIVTLDLAMPYIDGAAMLEMINDQPKLCRIVVSDTPMTNLLFSAKLKAAGASACLGKRELFHDPASFFRKINHAAATTFATGRGAGKSAVAPTSAGALDDGALTKRTLIYPVPADEPDRLGLIHLKNLSNAVRERQFDLVTQHVAKITGFPACLLTFIDRKTQWIKSAYGLDVQSTPRDQAFCNYTIAQGTLFAVANTAVDDRFSQHPLVTGAPYIKSYVGNPVKTREGINLGTLCVIDTRVRAATKLVIDELAGMSGIVSEMMDQRTAIAA